MRKKHPNFFVKELLKVPMIVVFLAMSVVFGFDALGRSAEVDNFAIVTAMGVDFSDEADQKFDLSLLMFVPQAEQSFAENYKMISASGRNLSEAIDFAGLHVGKEVGLTHIKMVVLSEDIVAENISLVLDFLIRSIQLPASTKLIVTDSSAKKFIEAAQKLDTESSIKVSDIITYNGDYIYAIDSSMESFFKGTFGPSGVGMLSVLSLEEAESEGIEAVIDGGQGQSSGQSSGSSGGSESSSEILNDGDVIICKNGKSVARISGEDLQNINLLRGKYVTGAIEVQNFSDEVFSNVNLIFEIFDHSNRFSLCYENGIPVVNVDVSLTLRLSEIESETEIPRQNIEMFVLSDAATEAIELEVKNRMASAVQLMRELDCDAIDLFTFLFNSGKSNFLRFLNSLADDETYLDRIVFKTSVQVREK